MKIASFCSGVGSPEVAANDLGWESVFMSEIAPRASAVLAHQFPGATNLGDMKEINGYEWRGAVDLIVAGTPCQGFSAAGKRRGLRDDRSSLALKFIEHLAAIRPRWFVWENVPNCRSTNNGRDFAAFLGCLGGRRISPPEKWGNAGIVDGYPGAYGLAWRVLDAQFFGVSQRRRRVFIVGHLGGWSSAAQALFEPHCGSGTAEPSALIQSQLEAAIAEKVGAGDPRGEILSFSANDFGNDCHPVAPTVASNPPS